jgi:hypothetical protein
MSLLPMAPGGRWVRPPHDGPPVYVPAKQTEAHLKRLFADGWIPIDDPRKEEDQLVPWPTIAQATAAIAENAMQARIDQLEAMVMRQSELVNRLLAQKSGEDDMEFTPRSLRVSEDLLRKHDGSTNDAGGADSQSSDADKRSVRRKPTV